MQADQAAAVALRRELNAVRLDAEDLREQLDMRTRDLSSVQSQLSSERAMVSTLQQRLNRVTVQQVSSGQVKVGTGRGKVLLLNAGRSRRSGQDERALARLIKQALDDESGISARSIATKVSCSPTTASKWKAFFEEGGQLEDEPGEQSSQECANE